jgi:hypothetical protein
LKANIDKSFTWLTEEEILREMKGTYHSHYRFRNRWKYLGCSQCQLQQKRIFLYSSFFERVCTT